MTLIFSEATATFEKLQLGCNMSERDGGIERGVRLLLG